MTDNQRSTTDGHAQEGSDPVAEAAGALLIPVSAASAPVRPRHQTSAAAVQKIAEQLFEKFDPTTPSGWRALLRRELPHIYVPSVIDHTQIRWKLGDTVTNGGRLFVLGASPGVGAKVLTADYARAFNQKAQELGDPRRVGFIVIEPGTNTVARFLDDLAITLKTPLSHTELRRSSKYLAYRVLGAAARQNVTALIIAQLSKAPPAVREALGTLLRLGDPNYHVDLEPNEYQEVSRRLGIVLVDSVPPETLFRATPEMLLSLENRLCVLRPYTKLEEVADAMRRADIGLGDLTLDDPDDLQMVQMVMELTSGLIAQLRPLLEIIDVIAEATGGARPSPSIVRAAMPLHRRMVKVTAHRADVAGGRLYTVRARELQREKPDSDEAAGSQEPGGSARGRMLRKKYDAGEKARKEAAATKRKGHINLPTDGEERIA